MSWQITPQEHRDFMALSGDRHPLHSATEPAVVHGLHLVLHALATRTEVRLARVFASFIHPILVGQTLAMDVRDDGSEVTFTHNGLAVARIRLFSGPAAETPPAQAPEPGPSGTIPLFLDIGLAEHLFPSLPQAIVAPLLATGRLVGMEYPGAEGLLAGLDVLFSETHESLPNTLTYRVERLHREFGLLTLAVRAPGMTGVAHCLLRPQVQTPPAVR